MATARVLAAGVLHECDTHSASFLLRQSSFILPVKHQNINNFSRKASRKRSFYSFQVGMMYHLQLGDGVFDFIVEIPKETSAKMEVATDEPYTPIKQDTNKGKLRFYPYNINWNYGLLPQTWEDPTVANSEVDGAFGDDDSAFLCFTALATINEGELDWKIVAISLDDPRASLVNDVGVVEKHFPGTLTAIRDWFRDYKIPDGKPANKFGLGNKAANKDYALKVITETNEAWAKLVKRTASPFCKF
ncbi:hypothetical protein MKX03_020091 [Papaver bracteatum]|nr:hypothetical protein MKX03_020091 [Papaver bracteatum]